MKKILHCFLIAMLLTATVSRAQTYVPPGTPLNSPNTVGEYFSNTSITLSNGFSANGANGRFHAYIQGDCTLFSNNLSGYYNYILTTTPRMSGYTAASQLTANQLTCQLMRTVQYYDGLGKPVQTVQIKGSPTSKDVVAPVVYDMFGRLAVKYLPYTVTGAGASDGSYKPTAIASQAQYYTSPPTGVTTTTSPFAVTGFEPSPLNRVAEQGAPGDAWQFTGMGNAGSSNHTVKVVYTVNDQTSTFSSTYTPGTPNPGSKIVALYTAAISSNELRTLARANNNATYAPGQLDVTISRDENWQPADGCIGTTETYNDKEGHTVLKRTYNLNTVTNKVEMLSTYYVYDDYNDLAFVLTPQAAPDANAAIIQATLDNLCYQYRYDWKQRLTQKKLPGKGWEFMVYNPIDQVILTQDANQRAQPVQVMSLAKYDGQGREIISGQYLVTGSAADVNMSTPNQTYRQALESAYADTNNPLWEAKSSATTTGYTSVAGPAVNGNAYYSINYYDDYTAPGLPAKYAAGSNATVLQSRGLPTASKTMVLNTLGNTTPDMLWAVHYYDTLGRSVQTYQQHYLGGITALSTNNYDAITSSYNFTNEVTATIRQHYNTTSTTTPVVTVNNSYVYDHMGRRTRTFEQINGGGNTLLSQLTYNEVGQLMQKQLHSNNNGASFLQPVAYSYNERGWLSKSSATLFEEQLKYNDGSTPQYNGNIANQLWGTPGNLTKTYTYSYDRLNRLTDASSSDNYNEKSISYDLAGNINTLKRSTGSVTFTDDLAYSYNSTNQLQSITDNASSDIGLLHGGWTYTYDGNGNLKNSNYTADATKNKKITLYNLLNLPQTGTAAGTAFTFTYDAGGQKLRKVSGTTTTDYISGIQYTGTTTTTPTISFIQTEEGRAVFNGTGYNFEYALTDHLGNSRLSFSTAGGAATAIQTDDYYAFGMEINRIPPVPSLKNEYLYNRKELQEELGVYDYGARFYDPVVVRWTSVDPMAEEYRKWSPYNYVTNNPIGLIDPNGMFSTEIDPNGTVIKHTNDDDPTVYVKLTDGSTFVVGFEDPEKNYLPGGKYTYYNPTNAKNYRGQYLIPSSAYNYSQGAIRNKQAQDLLYLKNGPGGFIDFWDRLADILRRDIFAPENSANVEEADDVSTVLLPLLPITESARLIGTTRMNLLNSAQDSKLRNLINDLYRENSQIGSGSSMDAYRFEQRTGALVGGKSHTQKILNYRTALIKVWRKRANLSSGDRQIVEKLLNDIQNALSDN